LVQDWGRLKDLRVWCSWWKLRECERFWDPTLVIVRFCYDYGVI
jgi:hypothetical protein